MNGARIPTARPFASGSPSTGEPASAGTTSRPVSALIADDEPPLVRALQTQLATAWPELQVVATARNGVEAAELISRHAPDLAFLDIQMPGLTGLEVAQGIEGPTWVVFVTAYDEYAVQAFEQEALDYLLKPVNAERLQRTVQRLQRALASPLADDTALLGVLQRLLPAAQAPGGSCDVLHQVAVADVLFFRADDKYTCVQTAIAEHRIRTPIAELAAQLDPAVFVQIHRSTVVNPAHLAGTRRDEASRLFVRVRGHTAELPVSGACVHLFKAM